MSSIKDHDIESRPRERLMTFGPQALSNAELLAIVLGSGIVGNSAIDIAEQILRDCNNDINILAGQHYQYFTHYSGIGTVRAITLSAVFELARRRKDIVGSERPLLLSASAVYEYMKPRLADLNHEEIWGLYITAAGRLHSIRKLGSGTRTAVLCDPKDVIYHALGSNVSSVILVHNHPSGSTTPSGMDDDLTLKVKGAAELFDLRFNDHIIIGRDGFFSYRLKGKL